MAYMSQIRGRHHNHHHEYIVYVQVSQRKLSTDFVRKLSAISVASDVSCISGRFVIIGIIMVIISVIIITIIMIMIITIIIIVITITIIMKLLHLGQARLTPGAHRPHEPHSRSNPGSGVSQGRTRRHCCDSWPP